MSNTIKSRLYDALKTHFGFEKFKGNQDAIMTSLLEGRDAFAVIDSMLGQHSFFVLRPALAM